MATLKIVQFSIQNFRNLQPCVFEFGPGINCIFGKNGNGKTNLLEAIYFAYHKKSFRKKCHFPEILSFDSALSEIYLHLKVSEAPELGHLFTGRFVKNKNAWFQHKRPLKKKPEIPSVFINPVDSYSFHTQHRSRREWFDHHFSLLSPYYKKALANYSRALKMRNVLLEKRPPHFEHQIASLDESLAELIFQLSQWRVKFLQEINFLLTMIFKKLFNETHELKIELTSSWLDLNTVQIRKKLAENLEQDLKLRRTLEGTHRDNYLFMMNGLNAENYSSLGQQKMAYLSLIFAYIELFRYKFDSYPILLIDDVSGELDKLRWHRLMEYLKERTFQVFLTTANENFRNLLVDHTNVVSLNIENGGMLHSVDNFSSTV